MKKIRKIYLLLLTAVLLLTAALFLTGYAVHAEAAENTYYTDLDEAAAELREEMKARKTDISINIETSDSNYTAFKDLLLEKAFEPTGEPDEGDYLRMSYLGYTGSITGSQSGPLYDLTFTYKMTYASTADQEAEMDTRIDELLASLDLSEKTTYEKVLAVYQYITDNVVYDSTHGSSGYPEYYSAYAALTEHRTVCAGYTALLCRLLMEQGIDCRIITGSSNLGNHAWCIIKLGNYWYYADPTWDAGKNPARYEYFLKGSGSYFISGDADHYGHTAEAAFMTDSFTEAYPVDSEDYDRPVDLRDAATDISTDVIVSYELAGGGGQACFRFVPEKTDYYQISVYSENALKASLTDGDLEKLAESDADAAASGYSITYRLESGESYYLLVSRESAADTVSFRVTADLVHQYTAAVTDPTYTSMGYTTYTCTCCGHYYIDQYTDALDGWYRIDGKWYYNAGGQPVTGWRQIGGIWYWFGTDHAMVTGWKQISGKWYYFTTSGAMVTGWKQVNTKWYYFTTSGDMVTGWKQINTKWYYFTTGGDMVTGWRQINTKWYYFTAGGDMATGWKQIGNTWYYLAEGGAMVTGWRQIGGTWYWFYDSGAMARNETIVLKGKAYRFGSGGACLNP